MFKRIQHIIVLAMLLFATLQSGAQVAMPDTVCAGTTRLYSVNDPTVPSTYTWKIDGVTQSSITNSISITWNIPGTYLITLQEHASNGCSGDIQSGTVHVKALNTSSLNKVICINEAPFIWYGNPYSVSGTYIDTISNTTGGCDTIATLNLTVNPLPIVNAGTYAPVCANSSSFILAGTPFGGSFSGTGVTGNIFDPALAGPGSHIVTYSYTDVNGCNNSSTTTIQVFAVPVLVINNPAAECPGTTFNITNPGITTGSDPGITLAYWTDAAGTIPLANPTAINTAGTYYISAVNASGCRIISPVVITYKPMPSISFAGGGTICPGDSKTLTVTFTGVAPFSFTYTDGTTPIVINGITSNSYQFTVSPVVTTTYRITAFSDAGCNDNSNNFSEIVAVILVVTPVRYPDITASPNVPILLTARNFGPGFSYNWSPPTGLSNTTIYNPVFKYDKQTEFTITIITDLGCKVVDTLSVKIAIQAPIINTGIFVPKAWTPNGDGHNDKLYPMTANLLELKYFRIFNRWGQIVFQTTTLGQGWDGIFKGQPQVMDTYTWNAEAIGVDGRYYKSAGNSILIR